MYNKTRNKYNGSFVWSMGLFARFYKVISTTTRPATVPFLKLSYTLDCVTLT